jgi:hypothetical protein
MQRHFTRLLLRPSVFSGSIMSLLAIALVSVSNWSYLLEHFFFYDYFFGPEGFVTDINNTAATDGLHDISAFIGQSASYNILIIIVAILVGLIVYTVLQVLGRIANDASATWESLHAQTISGAREIGIRWIIHIVVAFAWLVYVLLFINVILPFCILAAQVGIRQLWSPAGLAYVAFGTLLTFLGLHMHVIFIRLLLLRARVFGGNDAILEDEFRRKA